MRHAALFVIFMTTAAGCGSPAHPVIGAGCRTASDGILSLAWTVRSQVPSAASCATISHLDLYLTPDQCTGSVEISPVDCTLDRFRYDNLPEGGALVELEAVGPSGALVAQGTARVTLGPQVPATPDPLDLE